MLEIRFFEEKVQELFMEGQIQGTTHLCQGQEAVSVGAIAALEADDYLTITYRGHGHALARGMPMVAAFGELMGRTSGCCGGVGGSMHLTDFSRNLIGAFAIIGAGLLGGRGRGDVGQAARHSVAVALTFCGDGATNIGTFHEALNMAAVWKAPDRLRDREQPLRRVQPAARDDAARRPRRAGEGARDAGRDRRRPGRARRHEVVPPRRSSARARARARR